MTKPMSGPEPSTGEFSEHLGDGALFLETIRARVSLIHCSARPYERSAPLILISERTFRHPTRGKVIGKVMAEAILVVRSHPALPLGIGREFSPQVEVLRRGVSDWHSENSVDCGMARQISFGNEIHSNTARCFRANGEPARQ